MTTSHGARLLTINTGSSSLKVAVYLCNAGEHLELAARAERIGQQDSRLRITDTNSATLFDRQDDLPNHEAAVQAVLTWLRQHGGPAIDAVGHRVVHGGSQYSEPQLVSDDLIEGLRDLLPLDPDHLPQAIAAIEATRRAYPTIPQVACFDTAFHRQMPRVARNYALPRDLTEAGVVRYGFHGLSYEYIMQALRTIDSVAATGRVIIAHLGNGASMAAVRGGIGIDTTMGLTPTGGLVMGTRTGDLDPGVPLYLLQTQGMSADSLNTLVNRQSGLLGVSGTSADMRDLLEREGQDARAAEAIDLFCYQARKFVGALAAALGGLETLIFTGGIGERAASVRARICAELRFLGIELDAQRNDAHAPIVSRDNAGVTVRVIATDEDLMIARHTYRIITAEGASHVSV